MNDSVSQRMDKRVARLRGGAAGFTLLELILSLTILSMVSLLIGSGFRLGIKAWDSGDKEILETQRLRTLSSMISQNLKSAFPYKMEIDDEKVILFEGKKDSILFVTASVEPSHGGFKWIKYTYKDRTILYNEGILPDKEVLDKTTKNEEILDADIHEVTFEFLSAEEDEDWQDSWDFTDELPLAVRVSIEYYPPILVTLPMSPEKEDKDKIGREGYA